MTKHVEAANWWRVPAPELKLGKYQSVIIDNGELTKAVPDSKNRYLFSNTPTGAKSLAIVGTALQIVELLERTAKHSIASEIKDLQSLYMGVSLFEPKKRFSGVFPLNELAKEITDVSFKVWLGYPDSKLEKLTKFINWLLKATAREKQVGRLLYVKFSHLPEDGMFAIGKSQVSCKEIQKQILDHLPDTK